jgi:hypothetical protein
MKNDDTFGDGRIEQTEMVSIATPPTIAGESTEERNQLRKRVENTGGNPR